MAINRFEDLIAWQKARELSKIIYHYTSTRKFESDYGLKNQIRRSSVSVMANIAEGYERGSRAEFHRFLFIAKASCAELRSHIYAAYDAQYLTLEEFRGLIEKTEEVGRIIGGLRASIKKSQRC